MLFLCTSVVDPQEGPYVSGSINTLRAIGLLLGAAVTGQIMTVRQRFHAEMLLDHAALANNAFPLSPGPTLLARITNQQSLVLSAADAYRVLGTLALLLIPLALAMKHVPAPFRPKGPSHAPVPSIPTE
jgi:DHA2 family multidrug resistance protein